MLDYPNPTLIPLNGVVSLIACEATNLELLRKQEASERQLLEWKQAWEVGLHVGDDGYLIH